MTVPEDLASLVEVSDLALSPDAGYLAVATRRADLATDAYERTVVLFERTGSSWAPLGVPGLAGILPAWSPEGTRLALVEVAAGSCRVVVHDLVLRERRELLDWPDEVEQLTWSPSGRLLGFVARRPVVPAGVVLAGHGAPPRVLRHLQYRMDTTGFVADRPRHCFAIDLEAADGDDSGGSAGAGVTVRHLSGTAFDDCDLTWLGDDDSWAFVSRRHEGREWDIVSDVFVARAAEDGPLVRQLTAGHRLWGPLGYDRGSGQLYGRYQLVDEYPCDEKLARLDLAGGRVDELPLGLERSLTGPLVCCSAVAATAGGPSEAAVEPESGGPPRPGRGARGRLFSLLAEDGSARLVELLPASRAADDSGAAGAAGAADPTAADGAVAAALRRLSGDGVATAVDAAGGWVVVGGRFAGHPATVQAIELAGDGEPAAIFTPNAGYAETTGLLPSRFVGATAADGTHIDCWVLLPAPGEDVVGSVLYLPGGGGQFGWDYVHDFQVLATAGIAVIFGNARGSGGYGESWMRTICGPDSRFAGSGFGGVDRDDMLCLTRAVLEAHPQLPRHKVAVIGGSYGGMMAGLLGFTSDDFCAVVAERGPFDLAQMAATSDEGTWFLDAYIGRNVEEDPAQYAAGSVTSHVDGVKQPVLILHSEEDYRCPVQQAEALFTALRRRRADVTFVRFPGESHELSRSGGPVHRVQRIQIIRDWLVARLQGRLAAFELEA